VNDDGNTYGVIINQFFEDLTGKIFTLAAQITSVQADLGDTNTVNTILYNINQLTTINTILTTSTASGGDGVTSDKLRTGTTVQLHPDPYGGSHTPTSSWPAYTGTGEALASISVPTTESEILNFDYQAFKTALDAIVSTISARISQAQADIAAARIDICKAKKYTDAKQAGGVTERYWSTSGSIVVGMTMSSAVSGSAGTSASFQFGVGGSTVNISRWQSLLTAGYATDQATTTYWNWRGGAPTYTPPVNNYNVSDTVLAVYIDFLMHGNLTISYDSQGLINGAISGSWYGNQSFSQGNGFTVTFSTLRLEERTIYTVPDVSTCDTDPGGPHYISGSYS
jgi:hypothetical protein